MIKIAFDAFVLSGIFIVGFFLGSVFTVAILKSVNKVLRDL